MFALHNLLKKKANVDGDLERPCTHSNGRAESVPRPPTFHTTRTPPAFLAYLKISSCSAPTNQRHGDNSEDGKFLAKRLSVLLSYATGVVAADSAVFVDFDTLPSTAASLSQTLKFLLAEEARPLRAALVGEVSLGFLFLELFWERAKGGRLLICHRFSMGARTASFAPFVHACILAHSHLVSRLGSV